VAEVAIVGIGCRFPGGIHSGPELWDFLMAKGDGMIEVPADRWNLDRFYHPDPDAPGRMYTRRGGFLTDSLWEFDSEYFGISPREAAIMDPQQRLLLETAVEALDDAGLAGQVAGTAVGVYIGGFMVDNQASRHMGAARAVISSHTATSGTHTMLSNRLSFALDLTGPSMTIDTACSSSLVAIHEAAQAVIRGEAEVALAGGVNAMLRPETFISMCKGRFLAPDGRCKTFDAAADGYARGEGAGIIVLKPLAAAQADRDRIYAVIRASGANQDGRTSGITVPNPVAQAHLARRVIAQSGIDPADVGFVEAHGTGTAVGDPLEMEALGQVFGIAPGRRTPLVVGSIKASIGHTEAAAGVASVIKAALVTRHRTIPPQGWLRQLNPAIPWEELNLRVPVEAEPFPAQYEQANVAVNGFGYGGSNAHVVLQQAPAPAPCPAAGDPAAGRPQIRLLPVSGRTEEAARAAASALVAVAETAADVEVICDAAWARRAHHPVRTAIAYAGASDLVQKLRDFQAGTIPPGRVTVTGAQRPVFVFSGMGPQWWGMGRGLLAEDGTFARVAAQIDECFVSIAGWSILAELGREAAASRVTSTEIAQPANFLLQVALTAELEAAGVRPAAVLGHSVGEVSAAYVSGALSLEDALLVSCHRARLQATTAGTGGMLAVGLPEPEARHWLRPDGSLCIAAVNSPSAVTLAGPVVELRELQGQLAEAGVFARALRVEVPYHSSLMDPILDELVQVLGAVTPRDPAVPLFSSVTGRPVTGPSWGAEYWAGNVRQPVRFADGIGALLEAGHRVFLEVGPHPVLSGNVREILLRGGTPGSVISTLVREQDDRACFVTAISELYQAGGLDTARRPGQDRQAAVPHVDLPSYPWQRAELWTEAPQSVRDRLGDPGAAPMLGSKLFGTAPEWEVELSAVALPWLPDHVVDGLVVLPGAAYIDAALSAAAQVSKQDVRIIDDVRFVAPLIIDSHDVPVLRLAVEPATRRFRLHSRPAAAENWTLHATGRIVEAQASPQLTGQAAGSDGPAVGADEIYERLAHAGLRYGPAFRRITAASVTGTQVRASIDAQTADGSAYAAHPAVVDAALQCVALLADAADLAAGPVVPAAVRSVRRYGPLPGRVTVTARRLPGGGLRADLALAGPDGLVALELLGVEFRPVRPPAPVTARLEPLWYEPVWEPRPLRDAALAAASPGELTVVAAIGAQPSSRARAVAAARPGSRLVTLAGDLSRDSAPELAAVLTAAAGDEQVARVSVVVVPGPDSAPGTESIAGLVAVARTIGSVAGPPVLGVVLTECALGLPGDAEKVNLGHAGLVGARRVLLNEQPEARWRLVDADPRTSQVQIDAELAWLEDDADEVALRDDLRLVLTHVSGLSERLAGCDEAAPCRDPERSFRVEVPRSSLLADLALREQPRTDPGPGQIEVRVRCAGLNYKDALKALGMLTDTQLGGTYFGTDLGMECMTEVVRVGPGVSRYAPGDRVLLGRRDSLSRYLTVGLDEGVMGLAPDRLSDAGCASTGAFLTAHHALVNCARPAAGETVLVHGAAGGVGLACIQVARCLGAVVIGTASTPERRAAVLAAGAAHVLDSRSVDFVDEVRALTGGRGADVIVSSAPGEILRANLDAAAEFGRVVEVGKADMFAGGVIDLAPFTRNLSFIAVDIDRMFAFDRPRLQSVFGQVLAAFGTGRYVELPAAVYPLGRLAEAFESVLRSVHIGRVALSFDDEAPEVMPALPDVAFRADGSYLITGGYGAFGLATARWLVRRGARHLVLAGRGGPTPGVAGQLAALQAAGAQITGARLDVADSAAVEALLARIGAQLPPLRGVFHAAGVLDDQPYAQLTGESLRRVLEPKAHGAVNLHEAVVQAGLDLDYFVLYSSVSAVTGPVPQLSYASASATLDALAQLRQTAGLPALSVNWGSLSGGGMAESSPEVQRYLAAIGLRPIDMDFAASCLNEALRFGLTQVGIVDVDWARWASTHSPSASSPRVAAQVAAAAGGGSAGALRQELLAVPAEQRAEVVGSMLAEQVASVLGIPAEAVDLATPLPDLGLDSLLAVELVVRISLNLGVEVSALELSRGSGLAHLAATLLPALTGPAPGPGQQVLAEPKRVLQEARS
jgi:acyl transferase domain-containing protein/NADPH:quinone reductase-like Zn-dependent oxidoreductase/acyl carrier protein